MPTAATAKRTTTPRKRRTRKVTVTTPKSVSLNTTPDTKIMEEVKVETPKKETDPKSESVSIATNESPATIAGLADGRIILKNDFFLEKPRFFPSSIKF